PYLTYYEHRYGGRYAVDIIFSYKLPCKTLLHSLKCLTHRIQIYKGTLLLLVSR
ncbi:uncharacterized protein METZ01_LOCUS464526, partial [marine metagenome]